MATAVPLAPPLPPERAPRWSRPAAFGAWVRFGDGLLLAVDHALAAKLGVREGPVVEGPLEVSLAVTRRCGAPCSGCYQEAEAAGAHVDTETLLRRLEEIAAAGASLVAFGGGEPLLHPDVGRLAERARALGLVPVATTSGLVPLGPERLAALGAFAQINVSHDGVGGAYAAVRGFDGAEAAERAIQALRGAGVAVGWNLVLTRASLAVLEATAERARALGCVELQLLRYKPSGRAADRETYAARALGRDDARGLGARLEALVDRFRGAPSVRIDCSMIPLLAPSLLARGLRGEDLARAGIFGCEAGRAIGAVGADGSAAPCSFFERGELVPLGRRAGGLAPFHASLPEPCAGCALRAACRGGCQVVSRFVGGGLGPDPECLLLPERG